MSDFDFDCGECDCGDCDCGDCGDCVDLADACGECLVEGCTLLPYPWPAILSGLVILVILTALGYWYWN